MGSKHILTALRAANLSLGILKVYCWLRPVANIPPKESQNFCTQTTIDVYHGYDNNVSNNIKKLFFLHLLDERSFHALANVYL